MGVGWNFLFVSGTSLLTTAYEPEQRFTAQAINEFAVFGTMAVASLGAGALIHYGRWETINLLSLPLLILMLAASVCLGRRQPTAEGR